MGVISNPKVTGGSARKSSWGHQVSSCRVRNMNSSAGMKSRKGLGVIAPVGRRKTIFSELLCIYKYPENHILAPSSEESAPRGKFFTPPLLKCSKPQLFNPLCKCCKRSVFRRRPSKEKHCSFAKVPTSSRDTTISENALLRSRKRYFCL